MPPTINIASDAPEWAKAFSRAVINTVNAIYASLQRVYTSEVVEIDSPATASEPFLVAHNLGRTPKIATACPSAAGNFTVTADDYNEWGPQSIKVRFSVANTRLRIRIE